MESKMDKRLEQALEHASYVQTFHNQKRILQQKFLKECTCYYAGGTFIIDPALITFISSQKNIHIKIDAKTGKAEGNLFKPKPVVSNNPTIKVGQTLSGKIDFNKKKNNTHNVKPGQSISGKISKPKK